jgi:hypothetical protein
MQKEEIQLGELSRFASELKAAVEVICKSPPFRTSAKSCQFLRHIVQHTLEGNVDELKERLIGIVLLGRETTYDTGSDAGVRVRANDVRKRLAAYYAANLGDHEFTLELPAGSYVPRFYLHRTFQHDQLDLEAAAAVEAHRAAAALPQARELSLPQLALPTIVALFLCVICIRWQLTREHPFVTFWNTVFQDHHALLYVTPSSQGGQQQMVSTDRLEDTAPLFNLAGQFHAGIGLTSTFASPSGENDILILIGAAPSHDAASASSAPQEMAPVEGDRLVIEELPSGRRIVDRGAGSSHINIFGRAALLTIANGSQRSIQIDGTDADAIDSLIKTICEPDAFPAELVDTFQQGTVTQIVFPMDPSAQAVVFHESLPEAQTAVNGPL